MFPRMIIFRLSAGTLALALVVGFATTGHAQMGILCQYFNGQFDPLDFQSAISAPFFVPALAVETNSRADRIIKTTGNTAVVFAELGEIGGGAFVAEVNANFKRLQNAPETTCLNNATVRGTGDIIIVGEDSVIRDNGRMDGKTRMGTVAMGPVGENEINSIHRVNASLRFTAQGERLNGSPRYDRGTANTRKVYEAFEGRKKGKDEDVLLICTCLDEASPAM